jgi:hypothetical protein
MARAGDRKAVEIETISLLRSLAASFYYLLFDRENLINCRRSSAGPRQPPEHALFTVSRLFRVTAELASQSQDQASLISDFWKESQTSQSVSG